VGATCLRFNCIGETQLQVEITPNTWTNCPQLGGPIQVGASWYDCPSPSLFCRNVQNGNYSAIPAPSQGTDVISEGKGGGGCFIATAAFGSEMHPKVWKLRLFRDQWLAQYSIGRLFIQFYYTVSPPIANWIAQSEVARLVTRGLLWPIVHLVENFMM